MKTTFLILIFSALALAQATFNVTVPGENAVAVTLSAEAVLSIPIYIKSLPASGTGSFSLASPASAGATTFTLNATTGITTGMGALVGTEVSVITAIAGNVITVTRARIGTAAAAHSASDTVVILRSGNYGVFIANLISDAVREAMVRYPGPAIVAAQASIATQQAAIAAAQASGVTHVP